MNALSPHNLMAALRDGREIALIDVREQAAYGQGHPLLAINIPLSRLELAVRRFIPRLSTRTVVIADNAEMANRAESTLTAMGYTDLSRLDGGVTTWSVAGYDLFQGNYTLGNAFGLHVSEQYGTPEMTAGDLKARMDRGDDLVILDSRPMSEFRAVALPGSIDVPGSEQVYRFTDLISRPDTVIAVTCAGKTRGTLGSQSLINAGVTNPVFAVEHGTMGWTLAGFEPEQGANRKAETVSSTAIEWSKRAAKAMAGKFSVRMIDGQCLDAWRAESDRTLYLIDVRTAEEFQAGHLAGSIWVPGGELTGCTEDHLATRNARLCLVDDNGARATTCAVWLMQMGWPDVAVLADGLTGHDLVGGPETDVAVRPLYEPPAVAVGDIDLDRVTVIDVSASSAYMQGHIPGAWWCVRSALPEALDQISGTGLCVVMSNDDLLSRHAASDLRALGFKNVAYLMGGTAAWLAGGNSVSQGMTKPLIDLRDVFVDFAVMPGDVPEDVIQSYNNTVAWRAQLLEQFHRDGTVQFCNIS